MRKITKTMVHKWTEKPQELKAVRPPAPFPGKYPTRILFGMETKKGDLVYFGKPSWNCYRLMRSGWSSQKRNGIYLVAEFDRKGVIYLGQSGKGLIPQMNLRNVKLWNHYHPGMYADIQQSWMASKGFEISQGRNGIYGPVIQVEEF